MAIEPQTDVATCARTFLARGEPHGDSDVDLLVEGVPAATWPDAVREVERLLRGAHVDALRSEDAQRPLVDRARAEGIRLT